MASIFFLERVSEMEGIMLDTAMKRLPDSRRRYAQRYRKKEDRLLCVYSYLLLQYALREIYQVNDLPEFAYNQYEKPYFKHLPIYFNISHCQKGVCCIVSDFPVGIDMQEIVDHDVMRHVMCKEEQLLILQSAHPKETFTRLWTMKESYFKMLGIGLCEEMKAINFSSLLQCKNEYENAYIYAFCLEGYYISASIQIENIVHVGWREVHPADLYTLTGGKL